MKLCIFVSNLVQLKYPHKVQEMQDMINNISSAGGMVG